MKEAEVEKEKAREGEGPEGANKHLKSNKRQVKKLQDDAATKHKKAQAAAAEPSKDLKKQTNNLEKVAALGQLDVKQEKAMKATARGAAAAVKKESAEKDAITRKAATAAQDFTKMKDKLARDKTKLRAAKAVGDEALMNVKSVKLSEEMIVKQVEKAKNVNDAMKAGEELRPLQRHN